MPDTSPPQDVAVYTAQTEDGASVNVMFEPNGIGPTFATPLLNGVLPLFRIVVQLPQAPK